MRFKKYSYQKGGKKSWDEIFFNPVDIKITTFITGTVKIKLKGTLNPELIDVKDNELEVPILSYWIHHKDKGNFLLDTGLDSSYIKDPRGGLKGSSVDEFKLAEKENIGFHIKEHKITLEKVFLSHLHADHAAGLRELPENIPYIVGEREYQEYQPEVNGDFLEGLDTIYEIDFAHAQEMPYLGRSVDLLGDGSIWAIWTPGHTPGHMSFLLNGLDGPVLLTMDAAFIQENLMRGVAPSDYTWDVKMAQESLEKIIKFLKIYPQVRVGVGHETMK